jgi:hypothetical protein
MIFYRVLTYFQGVEEFSDILAAKLLSMVVMTFFTLLLFSSVIMTLSKLYLRRDHSSGPFPSRHSGPDLPDPLAGEPDRQFLDGDPLQPDHLPYPTAWFSRRAYFSMECRFCSFFPSVLWLRD